MASAEHFLQIPVLTVEQLLESHPVQRPKTGPQIYADQLSSDLVYGSPEQRRALYAALTASTTPLSFLGALSEEFALRLAMAETTPPGR